MRIGSLCTGIGGLDMAAAQHFGATMAWCSEIEPGPCALLQRHHPEVPNLGDLKQIDWASVAPVDILTAGYPCQPFSHAGKRKGTDDPRHLWPFVIDAVRRLRPRWLVAENVRGHLTLGFDEVLGSLAEAGFDAEWCVLRASDVGAPHQRARIFIVASDASGERHGGGQDTGAVGRVDGGDAGEARQRERPREVAGHRGGAAPADADGMAGPTPEPGRRGCGQVGEQGALEGAERLHRVAWGVYEPAIRRWERTLGRCAPAPTDDARRLSPPFVEWMMGYPSSWTAELNRTAALKALGNAVVPQQALAALAVLA